MPPVTANNLIVKYTVFTKASALPAVHLSSPGTQTSPALAPAGSRVWGRKGQGAGLEGQLLPLGFWLGAKAQGSVVLLTIRRTGAHAPSGWELSHQLLWTGGFRATFGPTPWVGPGLAPAAPDLTGGTGGVEVGLLTTWLGVCWV